MLALDFSFNKMFPAWKIVHIQVESCCSFQLVFLWLLHALDQLFLFSGIITTPDRLSLSNHHSSRALNVSVSCCSDVDMVVVEASSKHIHASEGGKGITTCKKCDKETWLSRTPLHYIYIYIYIYTHTHTYTHIGLKLFIFLFYLCFRLKSHLQKVNDWFGQSLWLIYTYTYIHTHTYICEREQKW